VTPTPFPTPGVSPIPAALPWVTSTTLPDTAPNSAFIDDPDHRGDKRLDSPSIAISSAATLTFRNRFDTEFDGTIYWDGGVLEVSINGGPFLDVTDPAIGGSFISGGYTGMIYVGPPPAYNPLAGRMAWSGNSGGFINTVVDLGPNVVGQNIVLRFRMGSDEAVGAPGWWIDTLSITGTGGCPTPSPTASVVPTPSPTASVVPTPSPSPSGSPGGTPTPSPSPVLRFCNTAPIDMNLNSPAVPYPSVINVSGAPGVTGGVIVTLNALWHQFPDNIDILLVGPQGQAYVLMADTGGPIAVPEQNPVTLVLRDFQPVSLPNNGPLTSGTFNPTNWETPVLNFAPPAPPGPYTEPGAQPFPPIGRTLFGTFGLTNPNGNWSLYVRDDGGNPINPEILVGSITGGWCIEFLPPTAAGVSISGRVQTAEGAGIRNARIVVTGNSLPEARVVTTGSFGYFSVDGLVAGETYVVTVNSQRYTFQVPSRVYHLVDNITDADFIADPFTR
jgi:hypothetical protein